MNKLNILITGGRSFNDYELLRRACDKFIDEVAQDKEVVVVTGSADGTEYLAGRYALEKDSVAIIYPNTWDMENADKRRVEDIVKMVDACICFWDGESEGTAYTVALAQKLGINTRLVIYSNEVYKDTYFAGVKIRAKRDCMRNFKEGQTLYIISVDGERVLVGDNMDTPVAEVYRKYLEDDFEIVEPSRY